MRTLADWGKKITGLSLGGIMRPVVLIQARDWTSGRFSRSMHAFGQQTLFNERFIWHKPST